jgi:hypothetical protein
MTKMSGKEWNDLQRQAREMAFSKKTLSEVLTALGLTHRSAGEDTCAHDVFDGEGLVFTGAAHEVWSWLRETGRIES